VPPTPPAPQARVAPTPAGPASRQSPAAPAVCVSSEQLFGAALEVRIDHRGAVYRLKQTALGKLILTK